MKKTIFTLMASTFLASISAKGIDKAEIMSIVSIYEDGFKKRLYGKLDYVFHSLDNCDKVALFSYDVDRVSIKEIDGNNVYVKISYTFGEKGPDQELEGWIQLTMDGKIKYDPILVRHPILSAFRATWSSIIEIEDAEQNRDSSSNSQPHIPYHTQLLNTGVPAFNLQGISRNQRKEKYQDILRWLIKNGNTWDATEPKVPCPEKVFTGLVKSAEQYL